MMNRNNMQKPRPVAAQGLQRGGRLAPQTPEDVVNSAALSVSASTSEGEAKKGGLATIESLHDVPVVRDVDVVLADNESDVEPQYTPYGRGEEQFMVYLNKYERCALELIVTHLDIASMNYAIRRFGVKQAIDVAEEKFGLTPQYCQRYYQEKMDEVFKKRKRTRR